MLLELGDMSFENFQVFEKLLGWRRIKMEKCVLLNVLLGVGC